MNYVILDTNTLFRRSDDVDNYAGFKFNSRYDSIKKVINKNNLNSKIKILIPKVVLLELEKQQKEYYEKEKLEIQNKIFKFNDIGEVCFNINDIDYDDLLKRQISDYIKGENIEIIQICNSNWFDEIFNKSILKKPPFEGNDGKSDKGFKDVVIWQSIIEYAQHNEGNFLFFTNDKIFDKNNSQLREEFRKETGQAIDFIKNLEEFNINIAKEENLINVEDELSILRKTIYNSKKIDEMLNNIDVFTEDIIINGQTYPFKHISYIPGSFIIDSYDKDECIVLVNIKADAYFRYSGMNIQFKLYCENNDEEFKINKVELIPLDDNVNEVEFE